MKRIAQLIAIAISSTAAGCTTMLKPLDQTSFEAAKAKCGLHEATYFEGGFGFSLAPFQDSPSADQEARLKCMKAELAKFDFHVVIETPPPA